MYDAAYPPAHPPAWEAVAAYIGGNTPHVWTDAEWEAQPARYRLPIYVRSNPEDHVAATDARQAIAWLRTHNVPRGCLLLLDLETAVDPQYVRAFDADVLAAGWKTCAYGSLSTIFHNPRPSGGYFVAHYTGTPHIEPGSVATQYADDRMLGTDYDASLVADTAPLWDTHATPTPQEDDQWFLAASN